MTEGGERMAEKKVRLFLAVNLSVAATRKIAEAVGRMARSAEGSLKVAWVTPQNLHVTLKFLGWARAEAVEPIRDKVRDGVKQRKGFELVARGAGAFPNARHARVLWAGVEDPSGGLARLAADCETWMQQLGFPREERPFHAHVTVGRVKEGGNAESLLAPLAGVDFGTSLIREVVLFESHMKSSGSEYIPLFRAPLDAPPYRTERQTRDVQGEATDEEPEPNGGQ
jgi:RNA 2',3'-cyclic 3'-phosphodiesterase